MSSVTFDTLSYVKKLEEVGFTRQQAEVQANAMREVIDERLVTRDHLDTRMKELDTRFETRMKELEYKLTIRLGAMTAASIACVATLVKLL